MIFIVANKLLHILNFFFMATIDYVEFLGENNRPRLKYCGKNVILQAMCKIMRAENMEIDDNSRIFDFAYIDAGQSLKIGKYSFVTWHCVIEGGAKCIIGDRCFIGPGSKLLTSTYEFNGYYTNEKLPGDTHAIKYGNIILENDSYIGAGAVVMPGVTIGEGAVVGSNTFVNKDLEPWGIYVGNPAKKIGVRQKPTEERRKIIEEMDWEKHF